MDASDLTRPAGLHAAASPEPRTLAQAGTVDFDRPVVALLGLPVDAIDMATAVSRVREAAHSGRPCLVSTPNLNFLVAARSDAAFRDSVAASDMSLADGMPLVWVARLLGLPIRERVAGANLFEALQRHSGPPVTVFFFGGPEGAAEAACERVNRQAGGLRCVGFDSPGFVSVEALSDDARIDRINASGAQFVVAALGAKKGQAWLMRNRERLQAPVRCHLGAVVNFAAGSVARAPAWLQRLGLEWLWRIKEEPALTRRYAGDGLRFLALLLRDVLPQWFSQRWRRPSPDELAAARLALHETPQERCLALEGAWNSANLQPLRDALAAAARLAPKPMRLQLAGVSYVDSAFVGLLMLAPRAFPLGFTVGDASRALRRSLRRHGARHLLNGERDCRV